MNTEFLKGLGLSDEAALAVMTEYEKALAMEYERGLSEGKAQLDSLKLEQLIDGEISKTNAKNPDLIKKLIDTDAITIENGEVTGLSEQLEVIRQENPFLFEEAAPAPKFTARPKTSDSLTKASFDKMSYMDRVKLYSKNPALYRKLNG